MSNSKRTNKVVMYVLSFLAVASVLATLIWIVNPEPQPPRCVATWDYLAIAPVQQQSDKLCWAASASAVLNFLQVFDPQSTSDPPLYTQCRLFNIAKSPPIDCCSVPDQTVVDECNELGLPDEVFDRLNPRILSTSVGGGLSWAQVKGEICPGERPFIFIATPQNGVPHTYVVKGFNEYDDETGQRGIYIDTHYGDDNPDEDSDIDFDNDPTNDPSFIDYDCTYLAQNGDCGNWTFWHEGTIYNIRRLATNLK